MLVKNLVALHENEKVVNQFSIGHVDFEDICSDKVKIPFVFNDIVFTVNVSELSVVGAETAEESDFLMEHLNGIKGSPGMFSVYTEGAGACGTYLLADEDYNASFTQEEIKERGLLNEVMRELAFECGVPVYLSMTIKGNHPAMIILAKYNGQDKHADIVYKGRDPDEVIQMFMRKCREEC